MFETWNSVGRRLVLMAAVVAILIVVGCGPSVVPSEQKAREMVEKHGGEMEIEEGHIVAVDLHESDVSDEEVKILQSLSKLKRLDLRDTAVTNEVLNVAKEMGSLDYLDISMTKVTPQAAARFRAMRPRVGVSGPGP